ncbi:MAG: VCBS repeat-containing protein [Planctomycetes bacterium]|nr:VCBS repeat-containing protein [Planctomycetota bacterium]
MRYGTGFAAACLGLASIAHAQRFGFTHGMLPADIDAAVAVALGDLDGDGDLDAFVGTGGSCGPTGCVGAQSRLCLNVGTGVFEDVTAANLPALIENTTAVALGDVDGDGDLDAFVGNYYPQDRVLLNDGAGAFTDVTATSVPAPSFDTLSVALGDVDGDGDLDAFVGKRAGPTGSPNRLFLNGGTGVFTDVSATSLPPLSDATRAVALGDVDGDGDLDAFVGTGGPCVPFCPAAQDRLYRNGGTGVFTDITATSLPAVLDDTRAVVLGDVDGDGDLDAFVARPWQNGLHLNGGTGVFTEVSATNLPSPVGANAVALGDVDGDGDLDAHLGGWTEQLFLNGGTGVFTDATAANLPFVADDTRAVALGDADGDGDLDAFLGNFGTQNRLYLGDGSGVFADVTTMDLPPLLLVPSEVVLGDVDGDGDLDSFVGITSGQNLLFLNGGTGGFTDVTATNLPALSLFTMAADLGDVDGDGDPDLLVGVSGQSRLYLNGGTGLFTDVTFPNLPTPLPATFVEMGDVDGDGDLDALLGTGAQARVLLNGGTGVFTDVTATNFPSPFGGVEVRLGDVDGDGDLDALFGNSAQDRLYLNGGTGVFTDVTLSNLPAGPSITTAVTLGDVDVDGDLDAFLGTNGQSRLYRNGGTGVFTDVTATNLPALSNLTRAVALGDVDGDGILDAFLGNLGFPSVGEPSYLFLNGGTGIFTDVTATDLPALRENTVAVALGDVDGDGDLDVFAANSGLNRLYSNLSRQVSWRGIPRVGKPLVLDLRGPANEFWVLAASLGSASLPLPPLGTLRLDPATLFVVGAGALDPQGRASLPFLVPSSPALVGLSAYWQAAVGPPPVLTNLEITTATGL